MSKRKIEDDKSTQNIWEKFKLDSKGFLFNIQIKQQIKEDEKSKQKLFEVYQGSREEKLTLLPTPSGEPTPGINGFRSITLQGMRDWENGIENITEFISKIITLSPPKGISSDEEAEQKFCLEIHLPFAFKGNQEANFSKNLGALLSIPTLSKLIGAFSYSTGGYLAEFLTRFPLLEPNPELFYRYDIHVYCENDTLVEKFETATNQCTFTLRLDCPDFALQPFSVENTNSGEETEGDGDSNTSSTSVVVWKSYKLVRASNANLLGQLMKGHLPLLKRKLILN
uniref:Uncharacterized protein n=1 Tax=Meloidogyne floridensis TaxID=298350 RepID=A0A915NZI6_9BILA